MKLQRLVVLYFSPTGSTARTAEIIGEALAAQLKIPLERTGFTRPAEREKAKNFTETDLLLVASPTYAGKLPNKLLPDLREKLHGNGALAVPVVTFGNRSYDHSLAELCALLGEKGFRTVAAGAFVCRHAFTDALAYGRPNWSDSMEMKNYAAQAAEKIRNLTESVPPLEVPGDATADYYVPLGLDGLPAKFLKAKPRTRADRCSRCGACAKACPMGAIDFTDPSLVSGICIKCQACVRRCTKQAKYFDDPAFLSHVAMLEAHYTEASKNEWFL